MAIKISLSETRIDQFDIEGALSYANNFISNLGRQWLDLANYHLRFQKMVFPDGISYIRGQGFGNARLGLIYELNQTFSLEKFLTLRARPLEPNHSGIEAMAGFAGKFFACYLKKA